eukprot:9585811-Prorocentrum_lima.AAC.1
MTSSLVGSEMCIRDSFLLPHLPHPPTALHAKSPVFPEAKEAAQKDCYQRRYRQVLQDCTEYHQHYHRERADHLATLQELWELEALIELIRQGPIEPRLYPENTTEPPTASP